MVEHGGGGSAAAAPIARDIMLFALYDGLPPLDAYPSDQRERIGTHAGANCPCVDPVPPATGSEPRMSYLEYTVKTVPTGVRKILYIQLAARASADGGGVGGAS